MLNRASPLARLMAAPMRPGVVTWLGIRPARLAPMVALEAITLTPGQGVDGDHYASATQGARQVTVIPAEHLAAIASYLGQESAAPELLRRNVVVRGINLGALKAGLSASARRCSRAAASAIPAPRWSGCWAPAVITRSAAMAASPRACWRAARYGLAT